ncbi:MAG: (p)ppGpp synthetase [Burkholderiaceae bacterium]|jgi:ppGpp synthetase/RelA/SpoT-type nucleotidyltranferase|nr:(p)ppGpp synthetase [Burkholderiaceae bacterium]
MPTFDFEHERRRFLDFHAQHEAQWCSAAAAYTAQLTDILAQSVPGCKLEWRVKDAQESLRKFSRKYRTALEESGAPYAIEHYLSDLIGVRVVCLYEDELEKVAGLVRAHFDVIEMTDKVAAVESTEASFGYKGLHLDLRPVQPTGAGLVHTQGLSFELQIRTVIQDSWAVLDHKIKYKKAIPGPLKRRINVLAALFELADREFRQIRDETELELREAPDESELEPGSNAQPAPRDVANSQLNAFTFLKIATHFFKDFPFEPHKVDGFVEDIHGWAPKITRSRFNHLVRSHIGTVKRYRQWLEEHEGAGSFNPYTVMRHCLYLGDRETFGPALRKMARTRFDGWIQGQLVREKPV